MVGSGGASDEGGDEVTGVAVQVVPGGDLHVPHRHPGSKAAVMKRCRGECGEIRLLIPPVWPPGA